jgi:two-component system, OmpR family, alkaline phosphatase synthesis response regulator PhoP
MAVRILLVEDEENLLHAIKLNLEMEGYEVEVADTGKKALKKIDSQRFDLLLLDVMLPEVDGFEICESLRMNDTETPVLFLTAKDASEDKIKGFQSGGDDYLTKPFNLEELLLRIKVLVKRSIGSKKGVSNSKEFRFGDNVVNFVTFTAKGVGGQEYKLTKKEVTLLKLLVEHKDTVVSRTQILRFVWGYDIYPSTRTIDNFIATFRKYFEEDPSRPKHFFSIRSVGYKFTD